MSGNNVNTMTHGLTGSAKQPRRVDRSSILLRFAEGGRLGQAAHSRERVTWLGPVWVLDAEIVEQANSQRSYEVRAVQPSNMGEQQRIADAFLSEKLLPRRVEALNAPLFKPAA